MMCKVILLFASIALCLGNTSAKCTVRHRNMPSSQPLLLGNNKNADSKGFLLMDSSGYTYLESGDNITLYCPGNYNYLYGGNIPQGSSAVAVCNDNSFKVLERFITIESVQCYTDPQVDIQVHPIICGGEDAFLVAIGYNIFGSFLSMYSVCFDHVHQTPLYTIHDVVPGYPNARTGKMSAYLFSDVDPVRAYDRSVQTTSFTNQLDEVSAKKYITTSNYLQYKLLVPTNDFNYAPQQLTTYFYFNSVPLWTSFQNSYWTTLETSIRNLAKTEGNLEVMTSVYEVLKVKDSKGVARPVYLYSTNQVRAIPIPKYLTKNVENPEGEQVIFVHMVHYPGVSRMVQAGAEEVEEAVCAEDVCAQLRWLPWAHVPAAQRDVICCHPNDALLHRRLQQHRRANVSARAAQAKGLLVGKGDRALYASYEALHS